MIVAHHPIVFSGLKKLTGKNYVEKTIIAAIKNDIAIYAIHTNLDNIKTGVNGRIAEKLGLSNCQILSPKNGLLRKLYVYVPDSHADNVRSAIFSAGGGEISNYSECSFNTEGNGTFKAGAGAKPFVGEASIRHTEKEIKIEILFPHWLENGILKAMKAAHSYEEVAYEIISLENQHQETGAGIIGDLTQPMEETDFLQFLKNAFQLSIIKHTRLLNKRIQKVALCGGAGSFLFGPATASGADIYITSDIKYHEFFDSNDQIVLADIGHYESEQFTIDLLCEILQQKFVTFAVQKTEIRTNPVYYYL
jgi:dinuclear metal center YbgI/SA1388 family protein